jgi:hypothetical protein
MTEELKSAVLQLEARLQRKEDELAAKTASFQEALTREQERSAEREAKEAARRNELSGRVGQLTEERAQLRSQLASLKDVEEEGARREQELKAVRRELTELKVKAQDERKELEEQLNDRRRAQERHRQEVSDLRCHISVIEHRLQHSQQKLASQDAQTEALTKQQEELRVTREQRDDLDRTLKTEAARFTKERRAANERIEALVAELRDLKHGPSRVEVSADYEKKLDELREVTLDACALCARPGGPLPPADASDAAALRRYVEGVRSLAPGSPSLRASKTSPSKSARRPAPAAARRTTRGRSRASGPSTARWPRKCSSSSSSSRRPTAQPRPRPRNPRRARRACATRPAPCWRS